MKDILKHSFDAAVHTPQITDYLHSLFNFHARENGFDVGVKGNMHKVLVRFRKGF